jgi:hypothetical protein
MNIQLAAEHGSHSAIGEGNMDGKVIGHSPQGTTASSLHGPSGKFPKQFEL